MYIVLPYPGPHADQLTIPSGKYYTVDPQNESSLKVTRIGYVNV